MKTNEVSIQDLFKILILTFTFFFFYFFQLTTVVQIMKNKGLTACGILIEIKCQ